MWTFSLGEWNGCKKLYGGFAEDRNCNGCRLTRCRLILQLAGLPPLQQTGRGLHRADPCRVDSALPPLTSMVNSSCATACAALVGQRQHAAVMEKVSLLAWEIKLGICRALTGAAVYFMGTLPFLNMAVAVAWKTSDILCYEDRDIERRRRKDSKRRKGREAHSTWGNHVPTYHR